ncbi:MAG: thioredoxin [Spirochaetaceae bacterium]|jgi:thioredoxin 1|nr:thioredoxin [Spirochaetaceae bacterium]
MSNGVQITAANFEGEVLQSPVPVLVDFWAAWCTPCKMIGPLLDQLGESYAGRLKIGKVNVDEENDLAGRHNIVSIPTLMVYKDGQIVRQKVGSMPKQELENLVKDLV